MNVCVYLCEDLMPSFLLIDPATRRVVAKQQSPTVIADPRYVVVEIPDSAYGDVWRGKREHTRYEGGRITRTPYTLAENVEADVDGART